MIRRDVFDDEVSAVLARALDLIGDGETDVQQIMETLDDEWRGGQVWPSLVPGLRENVATIVKQADR